MAVIAVDFESEFSDDCNLKQLGNVNYSRATNIFLVALHCPELDLDYVGPLEGAPWHLIRTNLVCVAHNAGFDAQMFRAGQEKGQIPADIVPVWQCSADLSAYSRLGRSLKDAVWAAYGVALPKEIRTRARNKKWPADFSLEKQEAFRQYCLTDARFSWRLWTDYSSRWAVEEHVFAEIVRYRSWCGVRIDAAKVKLALGRLNTIKLCAEAKIPWADSNGAVLSMRRVKEYCSREGIIPPESLAENSPQCVTWENIYGDRYPIVGFLRRWRKANMYAKKLEAMLLRVMANGRMPIELRYFGADTGRMSGSGGWNVQNLPREPFEGLDIRSLLVAEPGSKFVIGDYSAIEPRVIAWLCGSPILEDLAKGHNLYEADARLAGLWNGESGTLKKSEPTLYKLCKAQTLGIGYGMGTARFGLAAKQQLDLEFQPVRCQEIIAGWHYRNPGVKQQWSLLEQGFQNSLAARESFSISLPSGRKLEYFDLEVKGDRFTASPVRKGKRRRYYWGGVLFENVIQAVARDILRDTVLRLESAGVPVLFTSHDEVVCEVPADYDAREIEQLMLTSPRWAKGLPLAVELVEAQSYLK